MGNHAMVAAKETEGEGGDMRANVCDAVALSICICASVALLAYLL